MRFCLFAHWLQGTVQWIVHNLCALLALHNTRLHSVCTTSRRPPPGSQSNCCHFASNLWMKRNESSSGSIVNFEASFSILGALRFSLTKAKSLNLDNSATPLGNSCDYFLLDKLGRWYILDLDIIP